MKERIRLVLFACLLGASLGFAEPATEADISARIGRLKEMTADLLRQAEDFDRRRPILNEQAQREITRQGVERRKKVSQALGEIVIGLNALSPEAALGLVRVLATDLKRLQENPRGERVFDPLILSVASLEQPEALHLTLATQVGEMESLVEFYEMLVADYGKLLNVNQITAEEHGTKRHLIFQKLNRDLSDQANQMELTFSRLRRGRRELPEADQAFADLVASRLKQSIAKAKTLTETRD